MSEQQSLSQLGISLMAMQCQLADLGRQLEQADAIAVTAGDSYADAAMRWLAPATEQPS